MVTGHESFYQIYKKERRELVCRILDSVFESLGPCDLDSARSKEKMEVTIVLFTIPRVTVVSAGIPTRTVTIVTELVMKVAMVMSGSSGINPHMVE